MSCDRRLHRRLVLRSLGGQHTLKVVACLFELLGQPARSSGVLVCLRALLYERRVHPCDGLDLRLLFALRVHLQQAVQG